MALGPIPAGHVRGLLECAVCLEQYRSPKELDCQHSFCESPCLEQLLSPTTQTIQCPMCRATQVVPGGYIGQLKTNRTIQQFIDASLVKTNKEKVEDKKPLTDGDSICETCGRTGLATICIHCNREVCGICIEKHTSYMLADVHSLLASTTEEANSLLNTIPENAHPIKELRLQIDHLRTKMTDTMDDAKRVLDVAVVREQKRVAVQNVLGLCTDAGNTLYGKFTSQGHLESLRKSLIDKLKDIKSMSTSSQRECDIESSLLHIKDLCLGSELKQFCNPETTSIGTMTTMPIKNDKFSQTSNPDSSAKCEDSIKYYKTINLPMKTLRGFVALYSAVISPYNGDIAISDRGSHTVTLLDKEGNFKRNIGRFGSGEAEFNTPCGMDYTLHGDLLVADSQNHRIQIFCEDGDFIRTFSRLGIQDFQLNTPTDVCYNYAEDCYYVCDYGNNRKQRFNIHGGGIQKTRLVFDHFVGPHRIKYDSIVNNIGIHHGFGFSYYDGDDYYSAVDASFADDLTQYGIVAFSTNNRYTFVCHSDRERMICIYDDQYVVYKFPSAEAIQTQKPIIDLAVRNGRVVVVGPDFVEIY